MWATVMVHYRMLPTLDPNLACVTAHTMERRENERETLREYTESRARREVGKVLADDVRTWAGHGQDSRSASCCSCSTSLELVL